MVIELLSDKNMRGNVTRTHEGGSSAPEGVLVTSSRGFSSDSKILPGIINPNYGMTYLFSSVYNNIFNYLL